MKTLRVWEPPEFRARLTSIQHALDKQVVDYEASGNYSQLRHAVQADKRFFSFEQKTRALASSEEPLSFPYLRPLSTLTLRQQYFVLQAEGWRAYYFYDPPNEIGALYLETGPKQDESLLLVTLGNAVRDYIESRKHNC